MEERTSTDKLKQLGYESGAAMMAHGPHELHRHMATKMEAALGHAMPQMDVRFRNLSLSADIVVVDDDSSKHELPTIPNELKKVFVGPKKRTVRKEILKNISGVFQPGKITLLLGQPGSGKSALMKMLSGRFPIEKNITVEGDVTFNSVRREDTIKTLPQLVSYVNQRDKHFPTLTVKETLEFAHAFCGGEFVRRGDELRAQKENLEALEATKAYFAHYPEIVIQQLGLQNCQDTIVGDAMMRGISGGERKRVTTGEMEFGMKYVSLMDEISTGLDSAATYDIINTQRSVAHTLHKTVVIALLQPSPEVFSLFDDVMILNEGELMYHGPCDRVEEFFESLGFSCPPERDIADYLLDLGTVEQHQYELPNFPKKQPRRAGQFADLFKQSDIHHDMLAALDAPHAPELLQIASENMKPMPVFHQSFWASTLTLLRRQLMVTYRNKPFIFGRLLMITIMGLLYCTTFYQFDPTQVSVVMGVVFSSIMFLSLGQSSQTPTYMAERDIFYKQRGANFFRTASYVLATSVSQIPLAIIETIIFGTLVYWVCGFNSNAAEFIIFEVVLFLMNLAMGMWFFFLSAVGPNTNVVTPLGMVSVLVFIIFAGFIVTRSQIPDYLIWAHWISPGSWSLRALAINQYRSSTFDVCVYDGIDYCAEYDGLTMGEYYLGLFGIETERSWIAYGIIYTIAIYVIFMFLSFLALEFLRYEAPENVDVSEKVVEDETYALVETPKNKGQPNGKGEVILELPVGDREKNFVPVTVAFQDLHYFVPDPKNPKQQLELLKGINGFAVPGSITALMGSSGAGKTTLMDVIAGRKTGGKITGKIMLNGYEANDLALRRSTGYCEQMDVHSEAATIREALTFSSFLRQDASISDAKKFDSVDECIELLGLEDIADQIIRGSSVEQMKRLTIGVELAAQPSVIFLDEPTSGLDARSAKLIMDGVRKVADSGRTIICTIHQPSSEVFYLFDSLLLLKRGGETVFFGELGENCRNLIDYFENIADVTPLPKGYNPATWMLECIGAGVGNATNQTDFVEYFKSSPYSQLLEANMAKEGITVPSPDLPEMVFGKKRAADSMTQIKFVVWRYIQMYWRTPAYNLTRMYLAIFLALLFGLIFVRVEYASYSGLNSGVGMVFVAALFNSMMAFQSVLPLSCSERASFYRERASQTYNALWYFVGSTLAEIPYCFVSSLLFTVIFYPFVGFQGFTAAVLFWLILSLTILMQVYMGMMFAYAMPSEEVAAIIGVLINSVFILFMGFSPPAYAIPSGYRWLYTISPLKFPMSVMVSLVFADCDELPTWNETTQAYENVGSNLGCQPMADSPANVGHITVKEYTEDYFGMQHDTIARNFGIVIGCIVLFRILGLLALRFINHQKR
jgi:ABC-type multidrug transport system ATPase subunit/ABC-type multidrug transport system permease subunit